MTNQSTAYVTGGCLCGAVRYRTTRVAHLSLWCYCSDCLRWSGTDGYAGYMVKEDEFEHLHGEPARFDTAAASGRSVTRHFCSRCGSPLWGQTEIGLVSIAAGTLDEPELFTPTLTAFTDDAPGWARIPELT